MKNKLSKLEAISLILVITLTGIILNTPEYLIDLTGTGTIINIVYISIIGLIFCFLIYKLLKNFPSMDILDISKFIGGNFFKFIVDSIFIIFFLISIIVAISNFTYLIKSLYFSNYSNLFIILFFIAILILSNFRRNWSNKKSNLYFCSFNNIKHNIIKPWDSW